MDNADIKQKSTEEKIEIFKKWLQDENTDDNFATLNVFLLVKNSNNFDKSFFEHKDVIFNDILEYIDIVDALNDELQHFTTKLVSIYMSCIKNCSLDISTEEHSKMPILYKNVLCMMDFLSLSTLIRSTYIEACDEIYEESLDIMISLTSKLAWFSAICENTYDKIFGEEEINDNKS